MRIIGGKFKSRRFNPPAKKWPTRPTTDFAKEALFNILTNSIDFEATKMLDLFCGTGSHSYEFISRGCQDVTCVDKFPGCIRFVKETAKTLDIEEQINIVRADVFKFIPQTSAKYDYIFAGPPYALNTMDDIPNLIFKHGLLNENGWFVMEHNPNHNYEAHQNFDFSRNYGLAIFSFFENK